MAYGSKRIQPEEAPGAPEWMVTFSDCMTLLLTFFVLLISFSSFADNIFEELSVVFFEGKPWVGEGQESAEDRSSFLPTKQIDASQNVSEGSETSSLATGLEGGVREETESVDFHRQKVFLISSKAIFWGKSSVISSEGRNIMATMASFLRQMPSRVVVSENGPVDDKSSRQFGLSRAWAVVEYLTTKQNLDKNWFSIAATTTLAGSPQSGAPQEGLGSNEPARTGTESERKLEVVLLERSIYN